MNIKVFNNLEVYISKTNTLVFNILAGIIQILQKHRRLQYN